MFSMFVLSCLSRWVCEDKGLQRLMPIEGSTGGNSQLSISNSSIIDEQTHFKKEMCLT